MNFISAPKEASAMDSAGMFLGDNMWLVGGGVIVLIVLALLVFGGASKGRA